MQKDPLAAGELLASQGLWQGAIERLLRERRPDQQPWELPIQLRERLAGYYHRAIKVRRPDAALDHQSLVVELQYLQNALDFVGSSNARWSFVHPKMMTLLVLGTLAFPAGVACPIIWRESQAELGMTNIGFSPNRLDRRRRMRRFSCCWCWSSQSCGRATVAPSGS